MLKRKQAALTTRQIVILTILIISFIIILFLIFRLNVPETTVKEICHNSVILKGKSLFPAGVSLDCHTEYICISKTNKCDKIDNPDEIIVVEEKEEVYKVIADKMADCWWMFGEGTINYAGSEKVPDFYCSICNQIYFDSSVKEIFDGSDTFSQKKLYDYIVANKVPGKDIEYDEYLYGLNFSDSNQILELFEPEPENVDSFEFMDINLDRAHLIIMGMTNDVSTLGWVVTGAIATAAVAAGVVAIVASAGSASPIVIAAVGAILTSSKAILIAAAGGAVFGGITSVAFSGLEYLRPIIIEKDSKAFNTIECDHIVTLS